MFGKVYTAVNMDTGAYMAMKEVGVMLMMKIIDNVTILLLTIFTASEVELTHIWFSVRPLN